MFNRHPITARQYRLFCRVVCSGLVLLGLALLAAAPRDSQISCQRSSGQCAITHPGLIPAPVITFPLAELDSVVVEYNEFCCTSETPVWYNLTFELGGPKKSYRLLYAWMNYQKAEGLLYPAANQVREFLQNPAAPQVTVRLPDNRREDLFCGLFFLVAGLAYMLINARVIFSRRTASGPAEEVLPAAPAPGQKLFWPPVVIWLWWWIVPPICALLGILMLSWLSSLDVFGDFIYQSAAGVFFEPSWFLLAYFIPQAWIIGRLDMRSFQWGLGSFACGWGLYFVALMLHAALYQENFLSRAYSQGHFSIAGLLVGFVIGICQILPLRKRLAHASWWILFNALAAEAVVVIPNAVFTLFHRTQLWAEITRISSGIHLPQELATLTPLLAFTAIQGIMLLWMVTKDPAPAIQPVEEVEMGT